MNQLNELQRKINAAAAAGDITEAARLTQIYVKVYKESQATVEKKPWMGKNK
jgi:hypothetical protein